MARKTYDELLDATALYIFTHDRLTLAQIKGLLLKLSIDIHERDLEAITSRMNRVRGMLVKCDEQGQL